MNKALAVVAFLVALGLGSLDALRPAVPLSAMQRQDACLFACYLCFAENEQEHDQPPKQDASPAKATTPSLGLDQSFSNHVANQKHDTKSPSLKATPSLMLTCANHLCLGGLFDMDSAATMFWKKSCPMLRAIWRPIEKPVTKPSKHRMNPLMRRMEPGF